MGGCNDSDWDTVCQNYTVSVDIKTGGKTITTPYSSTNRDIKCYYYYNRIKRLVLHLVVHAGQNMNLMNV